MKKGRFITFEGGEGVGKSTQVKMLTEFLKSQSIDFILTREPGGTPVAEQIRSITHNPENTSLDEVSETLLFSAARRDHLVSVIWPALEKGIWVICDRYADSTMVYQGFGRGDKNLSLSDLEALYRFLAGSFQPDLTFVMDLDPRIGFERIKNRQKDRMEQMDKSFYENIRNGYLKVALKNPNRCVLIDANQDVNMVHCQIIDKIKERLL